MQPRFLQPLMAAAFTLAAPLALLAVQALAATPAAGAEDTPQLVAPADGATLQTFNPQLTWSLPPGTTQYQLRLTAADGPGASIIRNAETSFRLPAPPEWYGLLPDMTYTWQVRASSALTGVDENDPSWGPWSPASHFRTPRVSSAAVATGPVTQNPAGELVLNWNVVDPTVWLVEVQASTDLNFPSGAGAAPLVWMQVHSGVATPPNSYTLPEAAAKSLGPTFYWRVRPRVQGDGRPVDWSPAAGYPTGGNTGSTAQNRLTLQDSGSIISFPANRVFQLDLPATYEWTVTTDKPGVLQDLPSLVAMPKPMKAAAVGSTVLRAVGELPCHRATPACATPALAFQATVDVTPEPQAAPWTTKVVAAPVEKVQVTAGGGTPTSYTLAVQSGLPGGCARFEGYRVTRSGDTITVKVTNTEPAEPRPCTMIYGWANSTIALGSDFRPGTTYTVNVNDKSTTFTAS